MNFMSALLSIILPLEILTISTFFLLVLMFFYLLNDKNFYLSQMLLPKYQTL